MVLFCFVSTFTLLYISIKKERKNYTVINVHVLFTLTVAFYVYMLCLYPGTIMYMYNVLYLWIKLM